MSLEAPFNGPSPPPLLSSAYSSYTTPPPAAPYATLASCLPSLSSRWPGEPPQQIIWSRGSSPFSPATHALYSNQVTACYAHSSSTNGPPTNRSELHARRTGEQAQHSAAELKIEVREERSEKDDDDDLQNGHSTSGSPPSKKPRRSVERDRSQTSNNKSRVSQRPKKKRQPEEGDENRERTSFDIERQRLTELRRKKGMRVKKSFLRQGPNELDFHLDRPKNAPKKSSKKRTKAGAQEGPSFRPNGSSSPERLFQPQLLQPQPPGEWQGSAATTTTLSAPFARGHTSSPLRSSVSGAATTATATRALAMKQKNRNVKRAKVNRVLDRAGECLAVHGDIS
ncbi:hypothetical protein QOT17_021528 [Balamuthia mandrillaris]